MSNAWDIQLQNLRLGYGDHVVLDNVNATLPGGRITVILGGSGGGKSTLLRHIIGLARPMRGKILLGGEDIFALSDAEFRRMRRRMGVLFQDGALLGSLTLAENVGLPLREHTSLTAEDIRDLVMHKLALVGLEKFPEFYPGQLSGGMRKRAGLARALVTDPPILFCDEPTSGLDPINAAQMDMLLLAMKKQYPDMTIVVVSHDLASLHTIAEHVLMLHDDGALFSGSPDDLRASPDPYLRSFLNRKPEEDIQNAPADLTLAPKVRAALDAWLGR
jgi:phospholipid/cholesterol/gamma-HCH transport system ATP-binding protein